MELSVKTLKEIEFKYGIPPMDGKIRTLAIRTSDGGDLCFLSQKFCVAEALGLNPNQEIYAYTDELISQTCVPPYYTNLSNLKLEEDETVNNCTVEENTESKDLDLIEISENDPLYEVSSEKPKRFLIQKGGIDGTLGVLDWDPKDCKENIAFGVAADSLVGKIIDKVLEAQAKGKKTKDAKAKALTLFKWKDYEWRLACINLLDDSKVTPELVKWSTYNGKSSCYTIGYYVQGGNSADYEFSFETCGSRYFQHVHYSEKLALDEITYLVTEILNAAVNRYYQDYDKYLIFEQK